MTSLASLLLDYLPQILFGTAAIALILFSIVSIVGGYSLRNKLSAAQGAKQTGLVAKSLGEKIWTAIKHGFLKFIRFFGLFPIKPITRTFRRAAKWLKDHMDNPDYLYQLPWYTIIGPANSGKSTLVSSLQLNKPSEDNVFSDDPSHPALQWYFYDKGALLDVAAGSFEDSKIFGKFRGWKSIIQNLVSFRPRRPLNGMILTIPATYFTGPNKLSLQDLILQAQPVAAQLRYAEKKLGLKIPVYVIITKCDHIAGFAGTCNVLPPRYLQQILGWSNPYTLDTLYSQEWIDSAFNYMYNVLTRLSLDIFEQNSLTNYQDDVMVFAPEFMKIKKGLGEYLDIIFRTYNYQSYFYLRGLYFTGNYNMTQVEEEDLGIGGDENLPAAAKKSKMQLPFLTQLFQNKIFPEKNIATPMRRFLVSANHKINFMKVLIIVTILGASASIYIGKTQLSESVRTIYPSMRQINHALNSIKLYQTNMLHASQKQAALFFQENAPYVLNAMINYEAYNLRPYTLPASWLTFIHNHFGQALRVSFQEIIAQSMYVDFVEKANHIIKYPIPALNPPNTINALIHPLQTAEFSVLQGYVDAISILETNVSLYNTLQQNPSIQDFANLVAYLYDFTFTQDFLTQQKDFLLTILKGAHFKPFTLQNYELLAQERLYSLFMSFLQRVLNPTYNYGFLINLQEILYQVDNTHGSVPNLQELRNTIDMLTNFTKLASNPELSWLGKDSFSPGADYDQLMSHMITSNLFGKRFISELTAEIAQIYQLSRKDLQSYGSPLTGYFLQLVPTTDTFEPAQGTLTLLKHLKTFLDQPFMQDTKGTKYHETIGPDEIMLWDRNIIEAATQLTQDYHHYIGADLPSLHPDIQESAKILAQKMLKKNIYNLIGRAQKIVSMGASDSLNQDAFITAQLSNLVETAPVFLHLLEHLNATQNFEIFLSLRDLVFKQLIKRLDEVDAMLISRQLYNPFYESFDWWEGGKNLMVQAYDMLDPNDMKSFFANQTEQVTTIATKFAEPLVEILSSNLFHLDIVQTRLVEKWRGIINAINGYKNKKAKNHVMQLEKFLTDTGNKIDFDNCFKMITPQEINQISNNFFVEKKLSIENKIYNQCQKLSAKHAINKYNALSDYFNATLAGNFPFVSTINKSSLPETEATTDQLMAFFNLVDALSPQEMTALESSVQFSNLPTVVSFLKQVHDVKDFLDTYFMPKTPKGNPGLDFSIQFRANQIHELYGHHVINWGIVTGNKTYESKAGASTGRWEYGQIAAFAFKWANDSPLKPLLADAENPAYTNVQNRAIFLYEGPWALLRALMLNQANLQTGAMPGDNTLLQFNIPLSPDPRRPVPETMAQLFIKLTPASPQVATTQPFKIPSFPSVAPILQLAT